MRRTVAVIVVCVAAGVATAATLGGKATPSAVSVPLHATPPGPPPARSLGPTTLTAAVTPAQVRATATAWVTALRTRHRGEGPFDWLTAVAAITSPELLAQLRTARPTLDDHLTVSETVVVDAVYPSAVDPNTVTVTCEARIVTTAGPVDEPCATTVTVAPGAAGNPVVAAFQ